jgi:hypothetical protein
MEKLYKFLRLDGKKIKSKHGDFIWKIGNWYKEDNISLCNKGFHASKEIGQAFSYVQGELVARVSVKGKHKSEDDKEVWSEMRLDKVYKWEKKNSVAIAIYSAELCIENFERVFPNDKRPREAIEAAKKWLENPTKENEVVAYSAYSAANSAANSATNSANFAVYSAANSAYSAANSAYSAAYSAANSATNSANFAVYSAANSAYSAANSAYSAAYSAANSAANSAAYSAANSAAKKKIIKLIYKKFDEEFKTLQEYEK